MKIADIVNIAGGKVICGQELIQKEVYNAFSSDLLSDVLTINKPGIMLLTGVANLQTIRTAEMADIRAIVFVRNKKANSQMLELANLNGMCILESPYSLFKSSGLLFQAGLKPIY
jgi:predicted transcriptional regulator